MGELIWAMNSFPQRWEICQKPPFSPLRLLNSPSTLPALKIDRSCYAEMRGATLPRDRSKLRTSSGKEETLRRCKAKWKLDDVVVIDVECSTFPDVIIVDEPEPWKKNLHGCNAPRGGDQRVPFEGVISIDDEEDDDYVGPSVFDAASTSNGQSNLASVSVRKSRHPFGDDAGINLSEQHQAYSAKVPGRNPFDDDAGINLSEQHQAYSAKVPGRNHYGLDSESESGSSESDSDCSDCELIDSSFDEFHELWDKAYHNRRNGPHKARSSQVDQPTASGHCGDDHINIGGKNGTKQHQSTISGTSPGQIASTSRLGSPKVSNENIVPRNGADRARPGPSISRSGGFKDGDVMPSVHKDIINDREKLKETDEYKRAIEEEWASRQRQLQIQGEEAQRLKKRKKAETLRLLDIEKRQKQRVEEVRETQKKDEEHMNLKEQLRVEIRKELSSLEHTCLTMASLLRGLGIPVEGGVLPTSNEVHAAYKRALLKFHPDRASRMDVRQQVEAEEKFKLISRMKEKFLS